MEDLLRTIWLLAALAALAGGGGNACFFVAYRATGRGRRWGARVLATVYLGSALQGAAGVAAVLAGAEAPLALACVAQVVAAAGVLAVSMVVLRRRMYP